MKLNSIIKSYLDNSLVSQSITGGESTQDQILVNNILIKRLEKNSVFNNNLIIVYIVILLFSFLFLCCLILFFIHDKTMVLGLMSGEGLSIVFIIRTIQHLYKDKIFTDQFLYILPKLTSENEKIKYMETLSEFLK